MDLLPPPAPRSVTLPLFSLTRPAANPCKIKPTLAIDYGAKGGIVFNRDCNLYLYDMPTRKGTDGDETDTDCLRRIIAQSGAARAVGEHVHSFKDQGVVSVATFMRGAGFIDGLLCANGIPRTEIEPAEWIRWYDIGKKADFVSEKTGKPSTSKWKKHLKSHAEQLFPASTVTLGCADALLIWNYFALKPSKLIL